MRSSTLRRTSQTSPSSSAVTSALRGVIIDATRGKTDVVGYEYALVILSVTLAQCFLGTGALGLTKD